MACMEHQCRKCGYLALNNNPRYNGTACPSCGGTTWNSTCDEMPSYKEQARDERMERRDRRGQ